MSKISHSNAFAWAKGHLKDCLQTNATFNTPEKQLEKGSLYKIPVARWIQIYNALMELKVFEEKFPRDHEDLRLATIESHYCNLCNNFSGCDGCLLAKINAACSHPSSIYQSTWEKSIINNNPQAILSLLALLITSLIVDQGVSERAGKESLFHSVSSLFAVTHATAVDWKNWVMILRWDTLGRIVEFDIHHITQTKDKKVFDLREWLDPQTLIPNVPAYWGKEEMLEFLLIYNKE